MSPGVIVMVLIFLAASCQAPRGTMALVDPVFSFLAPDSADAFKKVARRVIVLPASGGSEALYAAIDAESPSVVFLSPLLASELPGILSRNATTAIAYLGMQPSISDANLYVAAFSDIEAARLSGSRAAMEASRLPATEAMSVAIVAVSTDVSNAFTEAYLAAGGREQPLVESAAAGFSQAAADRLRDRDVRIAYVSAPPDEVERWIRQAFDPYTFVMAEYPLPGNMTVTAADVIVCWNVKEALRALDSAVDAATPGTIPAPWKLVETKR